MNPWDLSASDLLIWGIVLHLIADWPLQNDWMANNKMNRREKKVHIPRGIPGVINMNASSTYTNWWDRHPAAYVHAGIHGIFLSFIFGWVAIPLAVVHLLIDTRVPVVWWSKLIRQTQPLKALAVAYNPEHKKSQRMFLYDVGMEVRFWTDQVFHIFTIAIAALLVSL